MGNGTPGAAEVSQVGDYAAAEEEGTLEPVVGAVARDLAVVVDARRGRDDPAGVGREQAVEVGHHAVLPDEGVCLRAHVAGPIRLAYHLPGCINIFSDAGRTAKRTEVGDRIGAGAPTIFEDFEVGLETCRAFAHHGTSSLWGIGGP